jgi:hypothetical protein
MRSNFVPIYIGASEGSAKGLLHAAVQGTTDNMLKGKAALRLRLESFRLDRLP